MTKPNRAANRVAMDLRLRWLRDVGGTDLKGTSTYRVAIFIAWQIDGRLLHSLDSIARELGISYNSVDRGVHELTGAGFLVREKAPTQHSPAAYRISRSRVPIIGDSKPASGSPGLETRVTNPETQGPHSESPGLGTTEGDSQRGSSEGGKQSRSGDDSSPSPTLKKSRKAASRKTDDDISQLRSRGARVSEETEEEWRLLLSRHGIAKVIAALDSSKTNQRWPTGIEKMLETRSRISAAIARYGLAECAKLMGFNPKVIRAPADLITSAERYPDTIDRLIGV